MRIEEKYPDLFKHAGCDCGKGWHKIMEAVCEKLKGRGVRFTQIKEKFGGLRIYLDWNIEKRIEIIKVFGLKDGEVVDKEVPESEIWIQFYDNLCTKRSYNKKFFYYNPSTDKFYLGESIDDVEEAEIEDVEFVKGRLASTGLVDAEPVEEENTDDIIEWAESESFKTCEGCGTKEGVTSEGGWLKTLCPKCRAKPCWWKDD